MKFSEMKYERPDMEKIGAEYEKLTLAVKNATEPQQVIDAILEHEKLIKTVYNADSIMNVRHEINTEDEFYKAENDFFDSALPLFQEKYTPFINALLESKFRPQAQERFGELLFVNAELEAKTFKPEIIDLLQQENKLVSDYARLMA